MSSPLDRAPGPDDPSPYAPKWAREGGQRREAAPTPDRFFPEDFEEPASAAQLAEGESPERFRLPPSLDPTVVPEPSQPSRRRNVWALAGFSVLAITAAAAAAWIVVGVSPRSTQTAH